MEHRCQHIHVIVDLLHPHGDIRGVSITELQAQASPSTRPYLTLTAPRCADCGVHLHGRGLQRRIRVHGDLHDPRFIWHGVRSWWRWW